MATLNLAARVAAARRSRKPITLANIATTKAQADSLASIYLRVVNAWSAGTDRINAAYAKSLNELQTDSADDIKSALDAITGEIQRLVLLLTPDLRQWALGIERWHRGRWTTAVLSATEVDLNTILTVGDVQEEIDTILNWNVDLVQDVSSETRRRIANAVFSGLRERKPAREVAKEISEATGLARARSLRIAADQARKMGETLNEARRTQAGLNHWKWRSSHKVHYRPEHQARDGVIYTDSGKSCSHPKAPKDRPGQLPNCGCTSQAVLVFED